MLDLGSLFGIFLIGLWVFCIVDVLTSDAAEVKFLPKWVWVLGVVLLFTLGALLWLFIGRPVRPFSGSRPVRGYGGDGYPAPVPRPAARRARPQSRAERQEEMADIEERIAERDRLLARWAEEDRRRQAANGPDSSPGAAGPPGADPQPHG